MAYGELFPVSWSKINDFQTCAFQYASLRIWRTFPKLEYVDNVWGTEVHRALEKNLMENVPLEGRFESYNPMMEKLAAIPGTHYGERKIAVDVNFKPVPYESKSAFLWAIVDRVIVNGKDIVDIDYKTGKRKPEGTRQLDLSSLILSKHYPEAERFHSMFIWTQGGAPTRRMVTQAHMNSIWAGFELNIGDMEWAYAHNAFPPRPSGLCRPSKTTSYPGCPVLDCPFNERPDAIRGRR